MCTTVKPRTQCILLFCVGRPEATGMRVCMNLGSSQIVSLALYLSLSASETVMFYSFRFSTVQIYCVQL